VWRITVHRLRIPRRARRPGGHLAGWHVAAAGQAVSSLADDFGETVVLILDYVGPAIATFMTLTVSASCREASLRGPVRAAVSLTGHGGVRGLAARFENRPL